MSNSVIKLKGRNHGAAPPPSALSTITVGSTGLVTMGMVFPSGAVPSGQGVAVEGFTTQTDVKRTWGDGSIHQCIVTFNATTLGDRHVTAIPNPGGSHTPTWPSASVVFIIGGTTYTATLPSFDGTDTWLNGALVREARVVVTPTASGPVSHPLLQVFFDVRSYAAGGHRVDICIQNARDVSTMDKVTCSSITFTVEGVEQWSASNFTIYSFTRPIRVLGYASLTEGTVSPDFEPYFQSRALPRFLSTISSPLYDTSDTSKWGPNGFGNMVALMDAAAWRPEIAPFPDWAAQYIVHKLPSQRAATLINGNCSGSWGAHIMQADGVTLYDNVNFPGFWFDTRSDQSAGNGPLADRVPGNGFKGSRFGAPTFSDIDTVINSEHVPNLTYLPYLVTGDRFYLDQTKIWANTFILVCGPGDPVTPEPTYEPTFDRSRTTGPLWRTGLTRELGHPLTILAMAAMACPDDDSAKSYFIGQVQAQLEGMSTAGHSQLLAMGITEMFGWEGNVVYASDQSTIEGRYQALWRSAYVAYALDFIEQQNIWTMNFSDEWLKRLGRTAIGMWQNGANGPQQMPSYVQVARCNTADTVITPITSWDDFYTLNAPGFYSAVGYTAAFGVTPIGFHGVEHHVILVAATRLAVSGASSALSGLRAYSDAYGNMTTDDLNIRSGYALDVP